MTQCIACSRLNLKDAPNMTRMGFGRCELETIVGSFVSMTYERECRHFVQMPPEGEAARRKFLAKEDQKLRAQIAGNG